MGDVAVSIGASLLIAAGAGLANWPMRVAGYLTRDDDGNRIPVTPGAAFRTRLAGFVLIGFGAVLIWYGPAAFQGPVDTGAP
jgi:hypothetical protein